MEELYMIEFELLNTYAEDFIHKVPEQRIAVDELILKGTIKSYTLALNRSKIWMVVTADSEFEVMALISQLPLTEFMIPSISPLMFHNVKEKAPTFSLN